MSIPLSTSTSSTITSSDSSSYTKKIIGVQGIRRRLPSFSFSASTGGGGGGATSWTFPRSSKSMEYAGNAARDWWNWGLAKILSKKPDFAKDLEMNEEETSVLGYHNKGNWRHVFYKAKKEIGKLIGSGADDNAAAPLPQTTFKSNSNI